MHLMHSKEIGEKCWQFYASLSNVVYTLWAMGACQNGTDYDDQKVKASTTRISMKWRSALAGSGLDAVVGGHPRDGRWSERRSDRRARPASSPS